MEKMAKALQALKKDLPNLDLSNSPIQTKSIVDYLQYYDLFSPNTKQYMGYFPVTEHRLAAHIFVPQTPNPRGTVFYLHGYTDHAASASRLIQYLTSQGFAVATYDAIGHGLSDGSRGYINHFGEYLASFQEFIRLCKPHLPRPFHLIGHSLGGAISKEFLFSEPTNPFEKVILLAPLIRLHGWFLIQLKYKVMSRLVKEVRREFRKSSHNEELLRFVKEADPLQLQTIPLKWLQAYQSWFQRAQAYKPLPYAINVIQGNQDQTVDWRYNCHFIQQKFPQANIAIVPGARHALFGESEPYWQQTLSHITSALNGSEPTVLDPLHHAS